MLLGIVLTVTGFSFFSASVTKSNWSGKKNIFAYILDVVGVFLNIWSISFSLLLVGISRSKFGYLFFSGNDRYFIEKVYIFS